MKYEIALQCLRQAIKAYQKVDGASVQGAFRDCVTDTLHLAHRNKSFKGYDDNNLYERLCSEAFRMYMEEREETEYVKVKNIPDKKLPLHSVNDFEFDSAKKLFEERLKGAGHGKEIIQRRTDVHDMRAKDRKENKTSPRIAQALYQSRLS